MNSTRPAAPVSYHPCMPTSGDGWIGRIALML